jgi:Arc/MetJ-type ribon-helix-helix transcriptional regulator
MDTSAWMSMKRRSATKATTVRLRPQDEKRIRRIIDAGWATSANGAVRYALTLASKSDTAA